MKTEQMWNIWVFSKKILERFLFSNSKRWLAQNFNCVNFIGDISSFWAVGEMCDSEMGRYVHQNEEKLLMWLLNANIHWDLFIARTVFFHAKKVFLIYCRMEFMIIIVVCFNLIISNKCETNFFFCLRKTCFIPMFHIAPALKVRWLTLPRLGRCGTKVISSAYCSIN